MTTFSFSLVAGETGPLVKGGTPDRLRIPTQGHQALFSEGDQVLAGTRIAEATLPGMGDLHSPMAGLIEEVEHDAIIVKVTGKEWADCPPAPADDGDELKEWLRQSGVNVAFMNKAATLIINAVPPEPGISIHEPLLQDYRNVVELGLETVKKIITPSKMFLVTAKGNQARAFPNCTVLDVPAVYPNGLDPLVLQSVTGQEVLLGAHPEDAVILSVRDLYFIGRITETGRPLTETIMTIGSRNHLVKIGTPTGFLVQEAGATVQPGDKVVLGGVLRGPAALNLQQGIDKGTTGLSILRFGKGFQPTDNFCLGCGECEKHCPSRIMPGMISRCAEFKHFTRAENFHIHSCIECGICGYHCKAQRPLLQYIRLAKYELALLSSPTPVEPELTTGGEA